MRLTLRTMLAYMNDILEPEDAELIGKKIEESEFATSLLHRTRDVMRRLRLGTPDVSDRLAGLDPNTVAEYLDNALAHDRVLDFEKVCLESDVHLAEVASCYQILALVLGEPAEVDPASRQRMYQLPRLVDAHARPATEAADLPAAKPAPASRPEPLEPGVQAVAPPPRAKPSVPEWARDRTPSRRGWWRTAAAVATALVAGVLLLAVTGQFRPGSLLGNLLGSGRADQSAARAPEPAQVQGQLPGQGPGNVAGRPEAEPFKAEFPAPGAAGANPPVPGGLSSMPPAIPPERADRVDRPAEPPPVGVPLAELASAAAVKPGAGVDAPISAGPTAPPLAQPPVADVADMPGGAGAQPAGQPGDRPEVPPGTGGPAAPAPLPPEVVGQLDSPMQVLLAFDAQAGAWRRLQDQTPLLCQTSYLSLPKYRPLLRLADQTQVQLVDGTQLALLPADPEGVPGLVVEYGHLVVRMPENAGGRLRLQVGDRSGTIAFADANSTVAIEVGRASASDADPETQPGLLTANLYATSGKILWQERSGREPVAVNAPLQLTLNDQPLETVAVSGFPKWIVDPTLRLLDQQASGIVERELAVGRSTLLGLRELAGHRRKEVRSLALRCLDGIGDFELTVAALNNPEETAAWVDYVEQLRAAVVRSPLAAAQVRTAMEKLHGAKGASLYELLWKYNDDTLHSEEADRLIQYLDDDTLAFRVVSFQTLKRITKLGINYRPEDTPIKRQPWIQKWEDRLTSAPGLWAEAQDGQPAPPEGQGPSAEALTPNRPE